MTSKTVAGYLAAAREQAAEAEVHRLADTVVSRIAPTSEYRFTVEVDWRDPPDVVVCLRTIAGIGLVIHTWSVSDALSLTWPNDLATWAEARGVVFGQPADQAPEPKDDPEAIAFCERELKLLLALLG